MQSSYKHLSLDNFKLNIVNSEDWTVNSTTKNGMHKWCPSRVFQYQASAVAIATVAQSYVLLMHVMRVQNWVKVYNDNLIHHFYLKNDIVVLVTFLYQINHPGMKRNICFSLSLSLSLSLYIYIYIFDTLNLYFALFTWYWLMMLVTYHSELNSLFLHIIRICDNFCRTSQWSKCDTKLSQWLWSWCLVRKQCNEPIIGHATNNNKNKSIILILVANKLVGHWVVVGASHTSAAPIHSRLNTWLQ